MVIQKSERIYKMLYATPDYWAEQTKLDSDMAKASLT